MTVIDKEMYTSLKNWCDRCEKCRPENQNIMYVNSHDRALTNATIKKMMFDIIEQEMPGEVYLAHYSAENFYRNMWNYYSYILRLYMHEPDEKDGLENNINILPPSCGWIVLIIDDVEALSTDSVKMQEMLKSVITFASKRASIILIGDGDYKSVFSGCEYANFTLMGYYKQKESPERESIIYENIDKRRKELKYYWHLLYAQLENNYFDYDGFKNLFKNTMEYIIPRVTKQKVYRKDINLIEKIGAMRDKKPKDIEGCKPWEFEAAQQFAKGLHIYIENYFDYNSDLSAGKIRINVVVKHRQEHHGGLHISGATHTTVDVSIDDVCDEMDYLAKDIFDSAYEGGSTVEIIKRLRAKRNKHN